MGYAFAVLAMVSFGALGLLSKLADARGCSAAATTLSLFLAAVALLGGYLALVSSGGFGTTRQVVWTALMFGAIAMFASWTFLYGLRFGKITTSWVIINLSALVPAVGSTALYHEKITLRTIGLLVLAATAVLLLWKDMQQETRRRHTSAEVDAVTVKE